MTTRAALALLAARGSVAAGSAARPSDPPPPRTPASSAPAPSRSGPRRCPATRASRARATGRVTSARTAPRHLSSSACSGTALPPRSTVDRGGRATARRPRSWSRPLSARPQGTAVADRAPARPILPATASGCLAPAGCRTLQRATWEASSTRRSCWRPPGGSTSGSRGSAPSTRSARRRTPPRRTPPRAARPRAGRRAARAASRAGPGRATAKPRRRAARTTARTTGRTTGRTCFRAPRSRTAAAARG